MVYDDEMDTILLIRSLWFNLTWVASPTSFCMHKGTHIFIHFPFLFRSLECVEDNNLIVFSKAKSQAYRPRSKYQKWALYNNLFFFTWTRPLLWLRKDFRSVPYHTIKCIIIFRDIDCRSIFCPWNVSKWCFLRAH